MPVGSSPWLSLGGMPRSWTRGVFVLACLLLTIVVLTRKTAVGQYWRTATSYRIGAGLSTPLDDTHVNDQKSAGLLTTISADAPIAVPTEAPDSDDKVIVMGRLDTEDTTWVAEHLSDWKHAIYTVNNTNVPGLHTPHNKGREANPYLYYIIQNYDKLPTTIAFLHAHRDGWPRGWHTDADNNDNVVSLRKLNLKFVQQNGYANLRCNWNPGCPDEVQWQRGIENLDPESVEHQLPDVWHHLFGIESQVPDTIATPCCAQFAVSRDQVLKRPLSEYTKYYQWLTDDPRGDHVKGLIFEYLWHIIFGKEAVYCPDMMQCYRDVYGGY